MDALASPMRVRTSSTTATLCVICAFCVTIGVLHRDQPPGDGSGSPMCDGATPDQVRFSRMSPRQAGPAGPLPHPRVHRRSVASGVSARPSVRRAVWQSVVRRPAPVRSIRPWRRAPRRRSGHGRGRCAHRDPWWWPRSPTGGSDPWPMPASPAATPQSRRAGWPRAAHG